MSKLHFIHLRSGSEKGGATIAYEWINVETGEPVDHGGTAVRYAIARCSPKEVFNKARGRLVAAGRVAHPERGVTSVLSIIGTNPIAAILADAQTDRMAEVFE